MPNVVLARPAQPVLMLDDNTAVVKLKWFHFSQNNSGGRFVVDDFQAESVFVQAMTAKEAISRVWDQLDHSFCHCCGERWSNWHDDDDGTDQPEIYGESMYDYKPMFGLREGARLHYYDGRIESYKFGDPRPAPTIKNDPLTIDV